jgi:hypothetical protein
MKNAGGNMKEKKYLDSSMQKSLATMAETFCFLRTELLAQGLPIQQANDIAQNLTTLIFKQAGRQTVGDIRENLSKNVQTLMASILENATTENLSKNVQTLMASILENATTTGKAS